MSFLDHINPDVSKITPYQPGRPVEDVARELGLNPGEIIKLASNECPLGVSPKALLAMKKACREMNRYPDGGAYYLRNKLADFYGVEPQQLVLGNGSNELIEFIGHCLLRPGTSAVMSKHAFAIYKLITAMFGAEVIEVPMAGLTHDLNAMAGAVTGNTRVIFICNPNNPTSSMVTDKQIRTFMKEVSDDILVVFDEAYAEIALYKMPETISYVRKKRNVIILRSFSKAYGLAGLRIGYGIAKPEIAMMLDKPRQPFNVNRMAQIAACAALDDKDFVQRCRNIYKSGAELITEKCKELKLEFEPPAANFILIKVGKGAQVFSELQKLGVIVRPMAGYQLPEWIRVSIGTEKENRRFLNALEKVLRKQIKG